MALWHGYLLAEITTALTAQQKVKLRDVLHSIGKQDGNNPAKINHYCVRLDKQALIIEAEFDTANITRAKVITKIATYMEITETSVDANLNLTVFGTTAATWQESRQAALDYLAANSAAWESEE